MAKRTNEKENSQKIFEEAKKRQVIASVSDESLQQQVKPREVLNTALFHAEIDFVTVNDIINPPQNLTPEKAKEYKEKIARELKGDDSAI